MKFTVISDLHGYHEFTGIYEEPELLILAGDLFWSDDIDQQKRELPVLMSNIRRSFPNLEKILIIPGNHDFLLEKIYKSSPQILELFGSDVEILVDRLIEYKGIKIYGSPRTDLNYFAFPHHYGLKDISMIPQRIDILVTHEAPRIPKSNIIKIASSWYEDPGNDYLWLKSQSVSPKWHFYGHIHFNTPVEIYGGVKYKNVSQSDKTGWSPKIEVFEI